MIHKLVVSIVIPSSRYMIKYTPEKEEPSLEEGRGYSLRTRTTPPGPNARGSVVILFDVT
jgi:hypothetical protein